MSKEWQEIKIPDSFPLLQKLNMNFFESQGFCFQFHPAPEFYPDGAIKNGFASDACLVNYQGQKVRLTSKINFDKNGRIESYFKMADRTPWRFSWQKHELNFHIVSLHPNGQVKEAYPKNWTEKMCANPEGPLTVHTNYAEFSVDCVRSMAFHANGVINRISNSEAWVTIRGQRIKVGTKDAKYLWESPDITFYENGSLKRAVISAGTKLETIDGRIVEILDSTFVSFDPDGKAENI